MSSQIIDTLQTPWTPDASGLWVLSASASSSHLGEDGLGMSIVASSGSAGDPAPFAERVFSPALDLSAFDELRFWLRSSREGDGSPARPFYLAFQVSTNPPGQTWTRLLPVRRRETWELHRLWLGDMPVAIRQAAGMMRLQSLDPTVAFSASFDDLIASTPEPLQDVDAGIMQRLDARFEVPPAQGGGPDISVPAIIDVPENPGTRNMPYILVTPLSIRVIDSQGGSGDVVDNYTTTGAFVRPAPSDLELEFRVDVFTEERFQKASLLEQVLAGFNINRHLVASGEALEMTFFTPSAAQMEIFTSPGRTPVFFRLIAHMETGERQFHAMAVPFLMIAPLDGIATAEVTAI